MMLSRYFFLDNIIIGKNVVENDILSILKSNYDNVTYNLVLEKII